LLHSSGRNDPRQNRYDGVRDESSRQDSASPIARAGRRGSSGGHGSRGAGQFSAWKPRCGRRPAKTRRRCADGKCADQARTLVCPGGALNSRSYQMMRNAKHRSWDCAVAATPGRSPGRASRRRKEKSVLSRLRKITMERVDVCPAMMLRSNRYRFSKATQPRRRQADGLHKEGSRIRSACRRYRRG
jgi:hypothetical protein